MRLLIISVSLVAFAACSSNERPTNSGSALSSTQDAAAIRSQTKQQEPCLNLNTAAADDLIKLPGIGEVIAKRIVEHRARNGRFRRAEEIIIIEGFSENKYRAIAKMICVE